MKNWPGIPGLDRPGRDPEQRVGTDRLGAGDAQLGHPGPERDAGHAPFPIRSWSESAVSARAFAIACTAAAAPEIVVMQGTRALERRLADPVSVRTGARSPAAC